MRYGADPERGWVAFGVPAALLALLVAATVFQPSEEMAAGRDALSHPFMAGLSNFRSSGREGSYAGVDSSRRSSEGERELSIRVPSVSRPEEVAAGEEEITISKSAARYDIDFDAGRRQWKYLSRAVRRQIDEAWIRPGRWRSVMIHCSATERGNAKVFDYHHRNVKKLEQGLAYHFVIGNGTYSGDGEIEVGDRWVRQQSGEPRSDGEGNPDVIEICLVGNFESSNVHVAQLEAFDELTDYLQARIGVMKMASHSDIDGAPTTCPGRLFPKYLLEE